MTEILLFGAALAAGFVIGVAWACRRLAGKEQMGEALRAVVKSGPGPWRPPK